MTNDKDFSQLADVVESQVQQPGHKVSPARRRLVDVSQEIQEVSAREAGTVAYGTPHLINCTLPHVDPKSNVFERRAGNWLKLTITSSKGIPYGTRARLYYAKLITRAIQTKSQRVVLAPTLTQLARELGSNTNGRALKSWQEQLRRCCASTWDIEAVEDLGDSERVHQSRWLIVRSQEYVRSKDPNQLQIFEPTVELSTDFYNSIISRSVPFDMRSLKALASTRSSLAMDLYVWATMRIYDLKKPRRFPFGWLMQQFGTQYDPSNKKHRTRFQTKLKVALTKIHTIWPELRVELQPGCLVLYPGRPHIRIIKT